MLDATVVVVEDPSRIAQKQSQIMLYHGVVQTRKGCLWCLNSDVSLCSQELECHTVYCCLRMSRWGLGEVEERFLQPGNRKSKRMWECKSFWKLGGASRCRYNSYYLLHHIDTKNGTLYVYVEYMTSDTHQRNNRVVWRRTFEDITYRKLVQSLCTFSFSSKGEMITLEVNWDMKGSTDCRAITSWDIYWNLVHQH